MSVVKLNRSLGGRSRQTVRNERVYAIAFDLDTKAAERELGDNWRGAYGRIAAVLQEHGFTGQQGSLYFGQQGSNPVHCVLAVQDLDKRFVWFGRIVRDLRMLRVEEQNDLMDALSTEFRFNKETG